MDEQSWLVCTDPAAMLRWLTAAEQEWTTASDAARERSRLASDRKLRLWACACCYMVWSALDPRSRAAVETASRYADGKATEEERADAEDAANAAQYDQWIEDRPGAIEVVRTPAWAATLWARSTVAENVADSIREADEILACAVVEETQVEILRQIVGNPWHSLTEKTRCERCKGEKTIYVPDEDATAYDDMIGRHPMIPPMKDIECPDCKGSGFAPCPWRTEQVVALARAAYEDTAGQKCGRCNGRGHRDVHSRPPGQDASCPDCHGSGLVGVGTLDPDRLAVLSDCCEDEGCTDERIVRHLRGEVPCPRCHGGLKVEVALPGGRVGKCDCEAFVDSPCKGAGWLPRTVPFFRGDAVLDLLLGLS